MQCESRRASILKQNLFSYKGGLHNKTEYHTLTLKKVAFQKRKMKTKRKESEKLERALVHG